MAAFKYAWAPAKGAARVLEEQQSWEATVYVHVATLLEVIG